MSRIAGVSIPTNKKITYALTYIFGINLSSAKKIIEAAKVDPELRTKELSSDQVNLLRDIISKGYKVEGDLRREVLSNIKRLKDLKTYRGSRHAKRLPCRGQKTRRNTRTVRGNKRSTAGSGRRPANQKT